MRHKAVSVIGIERILVKTAGFLPFSVLVQSDSAALSQRSCKCASFRVHYSYYPFGSCTPFFIAYSRPLYL